MKSASVLLLTAGLVSAVAVPPNQLAERQPELKPLPHIASPVRRAEWYVRAPQAPAATTAPAQEEQPPADDSVPARGGVVGGNKDQNNQNQNQEQNKDQNNQNQEQNKDQNNNNQEQNKDQNNQNKDQNNQNNQNKDQNNQNKDQNNQNKDQNNQNKDQNNQNKDQNNQNNNNNGTLNQGSFLPIMQGLLGQMGLGGVVNLNVVQNLGLANQIALLSQVQQLNVLQGLNIIGRQQVVTVLGQGLALNGVNIVVIGKREEGEYSTAVEPAPSRQGLSAQAILKHEPCLIDAAENLAGDSSPPRSKVRIRALRGPFSETSPDELDASGATPQFMPMAVAGLRSVSSLGHHPKASQSGSTTPDWTDGGET
ncbi:hypothetical protein Purlil1_6205 [Purpureocillium lilacinum]|uniref:Uncharacterized protein n=1 Tax=Purpureocillium lilacinum TaxID=33203 RepID=A0ABR0BZV5_PURLI|nr:hypothetical protein Purlil1_6205 [Purpureocillium lilacinum]